MIDQFLEIVGVSYVFVVDAQGEIISHTFVPSVPEAISQLKSQKMRALRFRTYMSLGKGITLDISAPILEGNVGYVHVGMDKGIIMSQMQSAMVRQLYLLSVIFILEYLHGLFFREQNITAPEQNSLITPKNLLPMIFRPQSISDRRTKSAYWLIPCNQWLQTSMRYLTGTNRPSTTRSWNFRITLTYLTAIIDNMADGLLVYRYRRRHYARQPRALGHVRSQGDRYKRQEM